MLQDFLHTFVVFHVNAFNLIVFFLKHNIFFLFVMVAIGYLIMQELKADSRVFVNDNRRMI